MINGALKLKKFLIVGREWIIHNLDGEDIRKVVTEMYVRKPNSGMRGMFVEYDKVMYNEIVGGRGRDCAMEAGQSFITVDGTSQDFMDLNFKSDALSTNNFRFIKTYTNHSFLKRKRQTSFHAEYDIGLDAQGTLVQRKVGGTKGTPNGQAPAAPVTPNIIADFSTIPSGTKYLYSRRQTADGECIIVTDVGYWLKENTVNDEIITAMGASLDALAPNGWGEIMEATIEPSDGDFDALEKALQASPDWNTDVTFEQFLN